MNYKYGNLLEHLDDYRDVFVTTNSFVKSNGDLVMGRGFAKSLANLYPDLPFYAGSAVDQFPKINCRIYGIIPLVYSNIGLFQVKDHWQHDAIEPLIALSTYLLSEYANRYPEYQMAVNFPGIGNGKLSPETVEPIIDTLPPNVDVWQFPRPIRGNTSITSK